MAMGEPAFLSEEYSNDLDPDLELVTTSGYGKNGAISVLQVRVVLCTSIVDKWVIDTWGCVEEEQTKR